MAREHQCSVCGSPATVKTDGGFYVFIECPRCGDFQLGHALADDFPQTKPSEKTQALASHLIRGMHGSKSPIRYSQAAEGADQKHVVGRSKARGLTGPP